MKTILTLLLALSLVGCARFSTIQTDESPDRTITTRATAWTFGTAKAALANFKASQTDKTQGAAVGSLSQETSGTNVVQALQAIDSILGKVKP